MIKLILAGPIRLAIFLLLTVFVSGCMTPQELEAARAAKANPEVSHKIAYAEGKSNCGPRKNCNGEQSDDLCKIFSSQAYCNKYGKLILAKADVITSSDALVELTTAITATDESLITRTKLENSDTSKKIAKRNAIKEFLQSGHLNRDEEHDPFRNYCWSAIDLQFKTAAGKKIIGSSVNAGQFKYVGPNDDPCKNYQMKNPGSKNPTLPLNNTKLADGPIVIIREIEISEIPVNQESDQENVSDEVFYSIQCLQHPDDTSRQTHRDEWVDGKSKLLGFENPFGLDPIIRDFVKNKKESIVITSDDVNMNTTQHQSHCGKIIASVQNEFENSQRSQEAASEH